MINQLPTRPAASKPLVESAFCFICGKDFTADPDLVRDTKQRTYHRRCYEDACQYQQSRRPEGTRPRGPLPASGPRAALPPSRTPSRPAAPPSPQPSTDQHIELTDLAAPGDDLWADLSGPANPLLDGAPLPTSSPGPFSGRRDSVWLYVLIGFGAAVPVVVLLFIAIQLLISSFTGPDPSVAGGDPAAVTAKEEDPDLAQSVAPEASPSPPPSPSQPENPFLLPGETSTPGSAPAENPPASDVVSSPPETFPAPERETAEPASEPAATSTGPRLTAYGVGMLFGLVCFPFFWGAIGAVLLRMACSLCSETPPGFGAALGISVVMIAVKALIGFLFGFLLGQGAGGIVALAAGLMSDGAILSGTMSISFGKGIVIALAMAMIAIGIAFVIGAVVFVMILATRGG